METQLKAGEIIIYDYRPNRHNSDSIEKAPSLSTFKGVQWNIERGYCLDNVIEILKSHHADIICLQELDIGCKRSGERNCAQEIAKALQMKCAFLVEFEELHSSIRSKHIQGGGVHGNAILSHYDLNPRVISHGHHPINWNTMGPNFREPRRGERAILAADIFVPALKTPILCYSLHFEVFCGIFGRLKQFADVLEDCRTSSKTRKYQLVFGDLNTMAHGVARFSSLYCQDWLRYGSIGFSEAAWWHDKVLAITSGGINPRLEPFVPKYLSILDAQRLTNPFLFDPFGVNKDTTLQSYWGLYQGKLDWTLLRGFQVLGKGMDNNKYTASDHKLLYVIIRPLTDDENDPGKVAYQENFKPLKHSRTRIVFIRIFTILGLVLIVVLLIKLKS